MRRLAPLLLLIPTLAACNLNNEALPTPNDQNIIYVTATAPLPTPNPEGVIYITATPNPAAVLSQPANPPATLPPVTLPPTALPTLAFAPAEELAAAAQQLRSGYYEEAVGMYQAILAQGEAVAPDIRAEAAFRLGQAALREGLFSDAVTALSLLITQFPQHPLATGAYFLRGDAHLGLAQWQPAIADFQQYLALRPGVIDSYAQERTGDAQLALGQTEPALAAYRAALSANRTLVSLLRLREKVAKILLDLGRVNEAVAEYDAILAVARNAPYRATIDFAAGQAILNSGDTAGGLARIRRVFDTYRDTPTAYSALQILLERGITVDGFTRGRVAFQFGDYTGAIAALNEFSSSNTLDQIPAELYLLLGRAYREIGNPGAAVVAFQTIIDSFPADPLFGAALLEQGRTRFLSGDVAGAIQTYLRIADSYGYLAETAAEALWRAGYLYGTNNDPARSREIFLRMAQQYPQDDWTLNGLFLAASAAVKNQEPAVAENLYGRIAALATGEDQAAAYFWVGRLATQRGDLNAAAQAFQLATTAAPDSFFAARAADLQAGRAPFQPPAQLRFEFDDTADRAAAEAWLRRTFSLTQTGDLAALSPELAADPRLIRGQELWSVAAYPEALQEFGALVDESRTTGNALASYQLALYLRDQGAYYSSIVAAADVINAAGVSTLAAPPYIARLRYPAYYLDLVLAEQAQYGIDPLLMLALIRQESLFNVTAISSAGAGGLMQVMPATGQYIAGSLGRVNHQDSDLLRPYISVMFGAYYLEEQLNRFDGNTAAALAAYNAGPGRAIDWFKLSGGEVDLLVTTITIQETRTYVQRIYSHYTLYRALYGG
ncbi:MAG: tetratricopeptide repeat protein [Anaerolineae bacterium]|nr:tetratricopeptide repeat protein [Anaerolineae bacterium]